MARVTIDCDSEHLTPALLQAVMQAQPGQMGSIIYDNTLVGRYAVLANEALPRIRRFYPSDADIIIDAKQCNA